jgi:hypothetical protein
MKTRTLVTLALSLSMAVLAIPATAGAATLWIAGDDLRYAASDGQANQVAFSLQPPHGFVIQEDGARELTAIAPCSASTNVMLPGTGGNCPPAGVERAVATLGDGHDRWHAWLGGSVAIPVQLFGGSGNDALGGTKLADVLVAGSGEDAVEALAGDDIVYVNDGQADTVTCGDGADSVASDPVDDVAPDCETAFVGAAPIAPSDVPAPPRPPVLEPPFEASVQRDSHHPLLRSLRAGVPFGVTCNQPCGVRARFVVAGKRSRTRLAGMVFGTRREGVSRGGHQLWVRPTARARRLLRKRPAVTLKLRIEVRDLTLPHAAADVFTGVMRLQRR